jgi:hypothetical protein
VVVAAYPPVRRVAWSRATHVVASRYPPIQLFERVSSNPAVWDALIEAEALVNPRIRDEVGEISLVPRDERVSGPGASYVMAAFTHLNPRGSRFSDGTYGVYYAAQDLPTAVAETAYHFGQLAADAGDGPRYEDFRVLVSRVDDRFHDLSRMDSSIQTPLLDPVSYKASQAWGRRLREDGSRGIHFPSVRRRGGRCLAIFKPRSVGIPHESSHLQFHWDGSAVRRYFDYGSNQWVPVVTAVEPAE